MNESPVAAKLRVALKMHLSRPSFLQTMHVHARQSNPDSGPSVRHKECYTSCRVANGEFMNSL